MTLKEYFDKARDEDGKLLVRFVKITDNTERTVVFSNAADVDATFDNSVEVSTKTLKTIIYFLFIYIHLLLVYPKNY